MSPWRECAYCGATTRARLCSKRCAYLAQGLRDIEVRGMRRPGKSGCHVSDWEMAEEELRLALARRMLLMGAPADIAVDEAGFTSSEAENTYRTLKRRGLNWPNPQREWGL